MEVILTTEFMYSIASLSKTESKRTNDTVKSIADSNIGGGLRFHKIEHPSDRIFSYSVNRDIRIIAYIDGTRKLFLYVGHHDEAYNWIARRKLAPLSDGRIKLIVINEEYEDDENALLKELRHRKELTKELRDKLKEIESDDDAIEFILGQPEELQDELFEFISSHSKTHSIVPDHFFKVFTDDEELKKALEYPLEQWRVFLHPSQIEIIKKDISQSVFINGAPGTGKTVCLIHRIKHLETQIGDDECLILTTFKDGLKDYLFGMLRIIGYDPKKTFIDDITTLKIHEGKIKPDAKINGLFHIDNNELFYYHSGKKLKVRHLLFDEYQDFKKSQINEIKRLIQIVPFTLSFDYLQTIYRNHRNIVEDLEINKKIDLVRLDYSYRINSKILQKLKHVVRVIKVLSTQSFKFDDLGLQRFEEELIDKTHAAIDGPPIISEGYDTQSQLETKLTKEYTLLKKTYSTDEIVITAFFNDLYMSLAEEESFHIQDFPKAIRSSYKFIPTLKGKEYKVGMVILDDTICEMLNINKGVFDGTLNTGFKGGGYNYRLNLNLLFVALSRFRDYLKVFYPNKYEIIIKPIIG